MATEKSQDAKSAGTDLVITRVFDAPRERVWQAWTDPETFKKWWGPKGFTCPVTQIDLRVGGRYLNCMRSPEGQDYWSTGVYREIVPPAKLVCTDSFADEAGNIVSAAHYGMNAEFPLELLVMATFEEDDGRTIFTLRHQGLPPGKDLEDCREGWNQSFDKLAELLAQERG